MKKSISYYLSDLTRLADVSVQELEGWIHEAPYSQPLHKLLSLKLKQSGQIGSEVEYQNAAYHNIDLDHDYIKSKKVSIERQAIAAEVDQSQIVASTILNHTLASDDNEELVEDEVLENKEIIGGQELMIETEKVTDQKSEVKDKKEIVEEPISSRDIDHYLDSNIIYLDVMNQVIDESLDVKTPVEVDFQYNDIKGYSEEIGIKPKDTKTRQKKSKKNKSSSSKKIKNKKESKTNNKTKKKSKAAKKKDAIEIKPIAKEIRYIYLEDRQKADFRIHEYNGESGYIKWLMSKKSINQETIVTKKEKDKKKKDKSEVSKKNKNKQDTKDKSKKKKNKKSKKKKVSAKKMVLKAAEQSVKKRDVIISETLADLLALQGYNKKAKKMYKQLSLIFPEKSGFFAARIKKLKKK